jgi:hypothetical protein
VALDTANPCFGGPAPSPAAELKEGGAPRFVVPARTVLVMTRTPVDLDATSTQAVAP